VFVKWAFVDPRQHPAAFLVDASTRQLYFFLHTIQGFSFFVFCHQFYAIYVPQTKPAINLTVKRAFTLKIKKSHNASVHRSTMKNKRE
jgi:hypothetical protein